MTVGFAVVRPEPGNAATADRLAGTGRDVLRLPFFAVAPLTWQPPDPAEYDALLLTSANAPRHAGAGLERLAALPVAAVGAATADAARDAGLSVVATGTGDAVEAAAMAATMRLGRLLHLGGRDRHALPGIASIDVYASETVAVFPAAAARLKGRIALVHSARAARRLAVLTDGFRETIGIAALSAAVAGAAANGWRAIAVAADPTDAAVRAAAIALADAIDPPQPATDKRP